MTANAKLSSLSRGDQRRLVNGICQEGKDSMSEYGDHRANVNTLMNSINPQSLLNARLVVAQCLCLTFVASTVTKDSKITLLSMN